MTPINDGGPAFPSPPVESATDDRGSQRDGMSLRDAFALGALQGDVTKELFDVNASPQYLLARARLYYRMADSMLIVRSTSAPETHA